MLTSNDVAKVYETILSIPGMNENVKIDLKLQRKNVLLISSIFKRGLSAKEDDKSGLLDSLQPETIKDLEGFADDLLAKAGLTELSEKLKTLGSK